MNDKELLHEMYEESKNQQQEKDKQPITKMYKE